MEPQHPMNSAIAPPTAQRGSALIVAMIMLIMLTMFALAAYKMGKGSLDIVGNMQYRNAVVADANDAIQQAISSGNFVINPNNVFTNPCQGNNTLCYDTNGDNGKDVVVTLAPPTCIQAEPLLNNQISATNQSAQLCFLGGGPGGNGTKGAPTDVSLCSNSVWTLSATGQDQTTLARATVTEGVALRVPTVAVLTMCP